MLSKITAIIAQRTLDSTAKVVAELGEFAARSKYLVGIAVESKTHHDNTAFTGGHTTEHREDYATMTVHLDNNEGIRDASRLLISDERIAEIADGYTLPEHLKHPDNYADAFIGTIIKGLTGYEEDVDKTFQDQADESAHNIASIPGLSSAQAMAGLLMGEVNLTRAQMNVLYRSTQIEMMEHVLRFLIARDKRTYQGERFIHSGVDYNWATGMLADALAIVNGTNGFNDDPDPTTNNEIYRGVLPQKSSLTVKGDVLYESLYGEPEPVWPPEVAKEYKAKKAAKAKRIQEELEVRQAELRAVREAEQANQLAAQSRQLDEIENTMGVLAESGFTWKGIVTGGNLDTVERVKEFYTEKYGIPAKDIHVIEGAAIYGGEQANLSAGSMTVYIRKK